MRSLGAKRISFVNFQPRRTFAAWTYYDETDDSTGQRHVPCASNFKKSSSFSSDNGGGGSGGVGLGVRLLCPIWHGSALFDETPLAAAKWNRLNPYQRCLWLVDELTWRFHLFLTEHPRIRANQVLDVPLDEAAQVAKADRVAVATLTARLRETAKRVIGSSGGGGRGGGSGDGDEDEGDADGSPSSGGNSAGREDAADKGAARPDAPAAENGADDGAVGGGGGGGAKSPKKAGQAADKKAGEKVGPGGGYKVRYDDIGDVQVREEMLARFRKAEQWGLKAWDNEYFKILDFPPHVLRVIAPDRDPDFANTPRGTKAGSGGVGKRSKKRMVVKRPPPRKPGSGGGGNNAKVDDGTSDRSASSSPLPSSSSSSKATAKTAKTSEAPTSKEQQQREEAAERDAKEVAALPLAHLSRQIGRPTHREVFHDDVEDAEAQGFGGGGGGAGSPSWLPETPLQVVRWAVYLVLALVCVSDMYNKAYIYGAVVAPAARSLARFFAGVGSGGGV